MTVEIKVPSFGESITEVFVSKWLKRPGDFVEADEPIVELESDKSTQELPSPASGQLSQILRQEGETAQVGEVIAQLEAKGSTATTGATAAVPAAEEEQAQPTPPAARRQQAARTRKPARASRPAQPQIAPAPPAVEKPASTQAPPPPPQPQAAQPAPQPPRPEPDTAPAPQPEPEEDDGAFVMPAARRLLASAGISASEVPASGPGGRLLKEDVERYLEARRQERLARQRQAADPGRVVERSEKVMPMTPMRRTIAQRLVQAQQTAALLTTFNEADMSAVINLRNRYKSVFEERHGVKLGFMSFFVRALVDALKMFPQLNAEVRGNDIVYKNYYDIGIAIGTGSKGLVVPILRNADKMTFAEIESAIADFGRRAKENRIELEELRGGTFTISNGGVYGSLLSTPIVNPPQSGILGMHAIQERPVAVDGQVVIRPMMYLALTYDHRLVDGREAVTFLRRIKECIEDPTRLLMEI